MIEIPRGALKEFRSVLRKSVLAADPRGPCPLVLCQSGNRGLRVSCEQGGIGLRLIVPKKLPAAAVCFPASLLAEFEGNGEEVVQVEQTAPFKGRAAWKDPGGDRVLEFDTADPSSLRPRFPEPAGLIEASPGFVEALAESARTASRGSATRSISNVLLRGRDGAVIGTDGRQLLVQMGFALPWKEDVLVPALPAFGCKELAGVRPVRMGRSPPLVTVELGPWALTLTTEGATRYPDIDRVLPKPEADCATLKLHPDDIALLLRELPRMPVSDKDRLPVTLDIGPPHAAVRARAEKGDPAEVKLERSEVTGKAVRLATDRRYLVRALKLGFTEVIALASDSPLLCRDGRRSYVWMPLESSAAVTLAVHAARNRRTKPVPQPNGEGNVSPRPQPPEPTEPTDPLAEAESLRSQLQEALARTSRLITSLRQHRRKSRAVQAALGSLERLRQFGD